MTTQELKTAVRADITALGHSKKDVSVSVKCIKYYSTSIHLVVKNPRINRSDLKNLIKKYERAGRDEKTGERLPEGAIYVSAHYADGAFDKVAKKWEAFAEEKMKEKENTIELFDGLFLQWNPQWKVHELRQHTDSSTIMRLCFFPHDLSEYIYKYKTFGTITA